MAILEPLDITIAFKVIGLHPRLNTNEKRVAVAIIEHFNRRTGQCDPSTTRLATLLDLNRTTITRAIEALNAEGVISHARYGGHSHRNSYSPNWAFFRTVDEGWGELLRGGQLVKPVTSEEGPELVKPVTSELLQDVISNCWDPSPVADEGLHHKPLLETRRSNQKKTNHVERAPSTSIDRDGQQASRTTTAGTAARGSAERRINEDLSRLPERAYSAAVEAITPEINEAAIEAEMHRRGAGIEHIRAALGGVA